MAGDHRPRTAASSTARQGVVERLDGAAGNAKNVFDTHLFQVGDDQIGHLRRLSGHQRGNVLVARCVSERNACAVHA